MRLLIAIAAALVLVGCGDTKDNSASATTSSAVSSSGSSSTDGGASPGEMKDPPTQQPNPGALSSAGGDPLKRMPKAGDEVAVLDTNLGRIVLMFFPDKAPRHVANFIKLAKDGFYNGTKFHRVIPGFMIQGGDPNSKDDDRSNDGGGGPGYNVDAEFNDTPHERGILSMARTQDPNGAGSQFFIVVKKTPTLDNQYTVFGRALEGMDVVDKIVALPRDANDNPNPENPAIVKSIKIEKWPIK